MPEGGAVKGGAPDMLANITDTVTSHPGLMFLLGCIFVVVLLVIWDVRKKRKNGKRVIDCKMMIGIGEIFAGIMAIVLAYIAYVLIKTTARLEKTQARRILDLMVIGSILFWLDILIPQESSGETKIQATAGLLIFLYGYGLLLLEKYREGRGEAKS